jgi:hypothetical protein
MGRELKRMPLDFNWPIDQLWKGFVNPYHSQECKACERTGLNPATKKISDAWYSFGKAKWVNVNANRRYNDLAWSNHLTQLEVEALVEAGRLYDFTHDFVPGEGWKEKVPAYRPTAEEVNEWNKTSMGHDSINQWICVKARAKSLGVYGHCEHCGGEGEIWQTEEIKKLAEDWQEFQPPVGDGFQLWSTTTEGHPMTPVFATLEALCEHCEVEGVSVFGSDTMSKAEWMKSLGGDNIVTHVVGNLVFI